MRTQKDGVLLSVPREWSAVQDPELADWLRSNGSAQRELIVEARLPQRKLVPRTGAGTRPVLTSPSTAAPERKRAVLDLQELLSGIVDRAVPLDAAGGVAVRATPAQVLKFIDSPLVKAVRVNRRLGRSA